MDQNLAFSLQNITDFETNFVTLIRATRINSTTIEQAVIGGGGGHHDQPGLGRFRRRHGGARASGHADRGRHCRFQAVPTAAQ